MHQVCKKELSESHPYLTCPFCLNQSIETGHGKSQCPVCSATFKIDDRVEGVLADHDSIRLSVCGIVCGACGLVQSGNRKNCRYCGIGINTAVN